MIILTCKRGLSIRHIITLALLTLAAAANATECKVEHWTWNNHSSFVTVEGVVSPITITRIYVQAFDKKGNFLGNDDTRIKPGGAFSVLVNHPNPTNELQIKYTCE